MAVPETEERRGPEPDDPDPEAQADTAKPDDEDEKLRRCSVEGGLVRL